MRELEKRIYWPKSGPDFVDRSRTKSKWEFPYSYDPFYVYRHLSPLKPNGTDYTDHYLTWNFAKHDELSQKIFGNKAQLHWAQRSPKLIEQFIREFHDNDSIVLTDVIEYCNVSNGYPVWRFDYYVEHKEETDSDA